MYTASLIDLNGLLRDDVKAATRYRGIRFEPIAEKNGLGRGLVLFADRTGDEKLLAEATGLRFLDPDGSFWYTRSDGVSYNLSFDAGDAVDEETADPYRLRTYRPTDDVFRVWLHEPFVRLRASSFIHLSASEDEIFLSRAAGVCSLCGLDRGSLLDVHALFRACASCLRDLARFSVEDKEVAELVPAAREA
ncbi:hypothetical protein EBZ80_01975 [bacterium]|nr:hypothetical protein [bacterium]